MLQQSGQGLTEFPNFQVNETQIILENNIIDSIPSSIRNLAHLQILRLRNNKLTHLPKEIGALPKLLRLWLSNNLLTNLPSEIGNLSYLSQLRLENNSLIALPNEIGNLTNLTHLYLDNNQLNYLPKEIRNLTKLVHLSIIGNKFDLPTTYSPSTPFHTIEFILANQEEKERTNSLITKKAFYFVNAKKTNVIDKYDKLLSTFGLKNIVVLNKIESSADLIRETNVVFIICPIDTHSDQDLVFQIAAICAQSRIRFYIFCQDSFIENDFESVDLDYWKVFKETKNTLEDKFGNEFKTFNSYEQLDNLIFQALIQHKPDIRLTNIKLENIGHFNNLELNFDRDVTCLVGENGSGKSTILKTLALGLIGSDFKKIDEKAKISLLRIIKYTQDGIMHIPGCIILGYTIDGELLHTRIDIYPKDNGNDIDFVMQENSKIVYNEYYLKSLIVGFPQDRGFEIHESELLQNRKLQPHVDDLIPLINGRDDFRLKSFTGWIANLYFTYIKTNKEHVAHEVPEEYLINAVFSIISKITKKEVRFITVTKVNPPEIWVETPDAPNGIPLSLISQGFKIIISWVGYLMQRFIDTFPLSNPHKAFKENAIVIIDEVDISMHPIWQVSFVDVLREVFPNTQFIISTHDPIIIGGLLKNQVKVLRDVAGVTTVYEPDFDPKGQGFAGILTSELFGLRSTLDVHTMELLNRRNELLVMQDEEPLSDSNKLELNQIFHTLNSLGINTTDRDPWYQKFIIAMGKRNMLKTHNYTIEQLKEQNKVAMDVLDEILRNKSTEQ
jgi:energy-coupling factor transporter ATP-binding protein EcfA2